MQILAHSAWRKLAKKHRRKRLRQAKAKERNNNDQKEYELRLQSPTFRAALVEQESAEEFQREEEERISRLNEAEWLKREVEAQQRWKELQQKLKLAREEKAKQNERIRQEWEAEQKRLKDLKEAKEKKEEEKRLEQQRLIEKIDDYIENGGDIPEQLLVPLESHPNSGICLFFKKTGACRFGDACSRNHVRAAVSKTILVKNFYSHYSLEAPNESEYGNDSGLEFESHEMVNHFKEFFYDVLPEMEKHGRVVNFKVCCNHEPHLRGNVYVEFKEYREAMKSFKVFNGRWYGGKQLNVEFANIESWKSAICGLFFKQRCPKGSSCNFLHVFKNPCNLFQNADKDLHRSPPKESYDRSERNWRWSESPEPFDSRDVCNDPDKSIRYNEHATRKNGLDRRKTSKAKYRSRSRSWSRHRSRSPVRRRRRSKSPKRSSSRRSKRSPL